MQVTITVNNANRQDLANAIELLTDLYERAGEPRVADVKETPVEPEAKKSELSVDDIRAKVSELIKGGKRAEVKSLLKQFGADTVTKLDEAKFADFIAATEKL